MAEVEESDLHGILLYNNVQRVIQPVVSKSIKRDSSGGVMYRGSAYYVNSNV